MPRKLGALCLAFAEIAARELGQQAHRRHGECRRFVLVTGRRGQVEHFGQALDGGHDESRRPDEGEQFEQVEGRERIGAEPRRHGIAMAEHRRRRTGAPRRLAMRERGHLAIG